MRIAKVAAEIMQAPLAATCRRSLHLAPVMRIKFGSNATIKVGFDPGFGFCRGTGLLKMQAKVLSSGSGAGR